MARAEAASASARADSIKGLAQSIANPAYRRLLTAEPALRRAVPALIIAFLLTIGVGAVVQVLDHRRQAIAEAVYEIENVVEFTTERFNRIAGTEKGDVARRHLLEGALAEGGGQLAVYEARGDALSPWRSDTTLTVTLSATTGFVLLILGFAFHWQATRAREADVIYDTVRSRIDTALNRGRCGLWDWDLARGRIFWSHSMFAILGLQPRDDLMTFGEVSQLVQ